MVWLNIPDTIIPSWLEMSELPVKYTPVFFIATGTSGNCSDVSLKIFSGVMPTNAETLLSHVSGITLE